MGRNDKGDKTRLLKDLLHAQRGLKPTFEKSVDLLHELVGWYKSNKNLRYCRREALKLRIKFDPLTPEQLKRIAVLHEYITEKIAKADARELARAVAKKEKKAREKEKTQAQQPQQEQQKERKPWNPALDE